MQLTPEVEDVIEALTISDGVLLARMSGSGATCFGLCDNMDTAAAVAARLQKKHPKWWVQATSILSAETQP